MYSYRPPLSQIRFYRLWETCSTYWNEAAGSDRDKKWMGRAAFLDLLGVRHLTSGTNGAELAIQFGCDKGGLKGFIVTGEALLGYPIYQY